MDYFDADRGPVMAAITGSGRFPAPSNDGVHGLGAQLVPAKVRDIESCLWVHARNSITGASASRSGARLLADERKARLAYPCGVGPAAHHPGEEPLYVDEELGLDLTNTVYALDSTTIALCGCRVFPWAHFRMSPRRR